MLKKVMQLGQTNQLDTPLGWSRAPDAHSTLRSTSIELHRLSKKQAALVAIERVVGNRFTISHNIAIYSSIAILLHNFLKNVIKRKNEKTFKNTIFVVSQKHNCLIDCLLCFVISKYVD
jgi:hypothetical protein